jgi:hypothetical protein
MLHIFATSDNKLLDFELLNYSNQVTPGTQFNPKNTVGTALVLGPKRSH